MGGKGLGDVLYNAEKVMKKKREDLICCTCEEC